MRAIYRTAMLIAAVSGCNSQFNTTTPASADKEQTFEEATEALSPCVATAATVSPASDGQTNFFYRDDIVFTVTDGAADARVELTDETGAVVSGTNWVDNQVAEDEPLQIVFTPDTPLDANRDYVATLVYCGGEPSVSFRTSSLGTQIQDPALIEGWTYTMDMSEAKVLKPGSSAQAILSLLDNDLAMQIDAVSGDTLDFVFAATDAVTGEQDTCHPSFSVGIPGNFAEAPHFEVGPNDVPFTLAGYTVTFYDAISSATFAANGSYFAGGRLSGAVDARDVVDALSGRGVLPIDDAGALCDSLANLNMPCGLCRDGEPLCLHLEIANISGEQSTMGLLPLDQFDCHEDCEASCDNAACDAADEFPICGA
jgi:hypothetical protein